MTEIGILVMAYGTASGPDDIERYYTDIRGGRPPSPEHLAELQGRYEAIGNRFPLLDITRRQARGLERALNAAAGRGGPTWRAYLGMKHAPPFIAEGVECMRRDGIERAVGLVLAPHWSGMSVATYVERVEAAQAGGPPSFSHIRQWYDHPAFVEFLAARVTDALGHLRPEDRGEAVVVFTAHSLPTRDEPDGSLRCRSCHGCPDGCEYVRQLEHTADVVGGKLGLERYGIAWQSAGRTSDPWWGPPLEEMVGAVAGQGRPAIVVCSAGFVADHLEILFDLDIEARETARRAGIAFVRTEMPNDDPAFLRVLAAVVEEHAVSEGIVLSRGSSP